MGFLRRRRDKKQEKSEDEVITITLDGLTSASVHAQAVINRHGEGHPESVKAMQQLAYHMSRDPLRHNDAAELLHHIARITYLNFGPEHPDTLTALYEAGDMQLASGNLELAEEMLRDALTGRERVLGRDHPDTLTAAQALGVVLTDLGRPAEAQALHEDVSERRARSLGAAHRETMISRGRTAEALRSAGRIEEAAVLFRELAHDAESAFGVNSKEAAIAGSNLAATEFQLGHAEKAAASFRAVLTAIADDPDQTGFAINVRNNLATVLFGLEEYHQAGELLRDGLAECERMLGPDHPDTVRTVANLARVLAVEGRRAEAARLTRRSLAHYESRLPSSHPRIAELRGFLDELS